MDYKKELIHECINDAEKEVVLNLYSNRVFYKPTKSKGERKEKIKSFEKHLLALKELLEDGVTLHEYDCIKPLLDEIKVPDFKYTSAASGRAAYIELCEDHLTSVKIGVNRKKALKRSLGKGYDNHWETKT